MVGLNVFQELAPQFFVMNGSSSFQQRCAGLREQRTGALLLRGAAMSAGRDDLITRQANFTGIFDAVQAMRCDPVQNLLAVLKRL